MPQLQHSELLPLDHEIERIVKRRRRGRGNRQNRNVVDRGPEPPPAIIETTVKIVDDKDRGIRDYAIPEFGFINQTNATLRGFETQLGQFAVELKNRPQGTLPSDTENPKGNHKEHVKVDLHYVTWEQAYTSCLYPFFEKLGIGEVRPTTVTLQLADRSLAYPKGKIEDILIKVDTFIFLDDFLVLDYEADKNVPIILGRPFLATGRTLIGVQKGELTMRVNDQQVTFNVFKSLKFNGEVEDCSTLGTISDDFELSLIKWTRSEQTVGTDEDISEDDLIKVIEAFEQLDFTDRPTQVPSIIKAPDLDLKPLPNHLKYAYLMEEEK
ncbi:hypothetical protein L6452_14663 [Arctium lappa]|uniref:Uncharacterized protein n=1 Tax=Arctium lappa TaxID=4217 RepID=A0ACB9CLH1_ARCLA|nr:hypothetical protein L6452_14663 [Arctium lappa]